MSVTINGSGAITFNDGSVQNTASLPGMRNRIINGDMRIDQRNAGASVTPTNASYTLDRWQASLLAASKFTVQQNAGSVTPPVGFINYLGVTSSSSYSVTSGDVFAIGQQIEGNNIADLAWGTASASPVTLSFWVRSSLTGTFGGAIKNGAQNRSYAFTYTISSANTWEQKSVTIAGDTTGTWATNNSSGFIITLGLGAGSTYSGSAGSWASANYFTATGATSVVGTNGATFYITGVQLEKGSTATSFDYRPYGQELALCQRYYFQTADRLTYKHFASGMWYTGTITQLNMKFPVIMRASPTVTINSASYFDVWAANTTLVASSLSSADSTIEDVTFAFTASGGTAGQGCVLGQTNSANKARIYAAAEL